MPTSGGTMALQPYAEDRLETCHTISRPSSSKVSPFGKYANQFHPPPGYSYPAPQHSFPGTPFFYHHSTSNMTPCSQQDTSTRQKVMSYGPLCQWYELPHGGYGENQMFPPSAVFRMQADITRYTSSSPSTPWKLSSHCANIIQCFSTWTFFQHTWETTHLPPNLKIPVHTRPMEKWHPRDCKLTSIT